MRAGLGLVMVVLMSCGGEPHGPLEVTRDEGALSGCELALPEGTTKVVASAQGVAFGTRVEEEDRVLRANGAGCALTVTGAPIAGELLDLDDHGTTYVMPRKADAPGLVSTLQEDHSLSAMKVTGDDAVSAVIGTGRGLWSFGVSPGGETLWASACGPTGIFTTDSDGMTRRLASPDTLWEQRPAVLTDDGTFWSVGVRTCRVEPLTPECGYALVRTRADGSHNVGTTLQDFGAGLEEGSLARCGHTVCASFPSGVLTWDEEGRVTGRWSLEALGARAGERVAAVTGTDGSLYVTFSGGAAMRAVFLRR